VIDHKNMSCDDERREKGRYGNDKRLLTTKRDFTMVIIILRVFSMYENAKSHLTAVLLRNNFVKS